MKNKLLTLLAFHLGLAAVVAQPIITHQPKWQTNLVGATATFSVGATGTPPLLYQWRRLASSLPGQTNSTLVFTNLQLSQQAIYFVVVSNVEGSVTSSAARLYVVTPPTITPVNPTAKLFADVTLFATNGSPAPLSYQWLLNGEPIAGAVANRLTVTNVQMTNAGAAYAIVATYAFGSATSQVATLTITPFNSIHCFGYSWTDTQAIKHGCSAPTQCPACFWQGRYSNGPMWPEFLSTNLGLTYVESNNYAHCGAGALDVLNQVSTSLRVPPKPQLSLFCLMFSDDILSVLPGVTPFIDATNTSAWNQIVAAGVANNSNAVQRLYELGARTILVHGEIDAGIFPSIRSAFATDAFRLSKVSEYCRRYDAGFFEAVKAIEKSNPDLRLVWVDLFSKLNDVAKNPRAYGFTKSTIGALDDPDLTDKSFTGPGADYVFWNWTHGTSKLNEYEFKWTAEALMNARPETLEVTRVPGGVELRSGHLLIGRDYTLQKSSDLVSWNDVQTFTASTGTNQLTHPVSAGVASAFFRLRW